jgi:F5/8 type C domain-containing protein
LGINRSGAGSYITCGVALNAFDNSLTTSWHTQWRLAKPPHPHHLKVDMSETHIMHGFYFIPNNNIPTGNPQKVHVEVSVDGSSWINTGTFTFQNTYNKQTFYLNTPVPAKYFKFVVDSSFANTHFTHLLEIGAF